MVARPFLAAQRSPARHPTQSIPLPVRAEIAQRVEHRVAGIVLPASMCGSSRPGTSRNLPPRWETPPIALGDRREEELIRLPDQVPLFRRRGQVRRTRGLSRFAGLSSLAGPSGLIYFSGSSNIPRSHESEKPPGRGSSRSVQRHPFRFQKSRARTPPLLRPRETDRYPPASGIDGAREPRDSRHEGTAPDSPGFIPIAPQHHPLLQEESVRILRNEIR